MSVDLLAIVVQIQLDYEPLTCQHLLPCQGQGEGTGLRVQCDDPALLAF